MQEIDFYQALLSLPDLVVDGVELSPKRITLSCHVSTPQQPCPHCLRPTTQVNQHTRRQVRDLDISGRQRGRPAVWLAVRMRQFFCPDCDRHFTERLAFAEPGKSHTHRQANRGADRWIFDCWAKQPFTEVGALLDVNAKTVERIYYRQVQASLDLPARYAAVRRIGIDEPGGRSHRPPQGQGQLLLRAGGPGQEHRSGRAAQPHE